jgi:hypothetical protein
MNRSDLREDLSRTISNCNQFTPTQSHPLPRIVLAVRSNPGLFLTEHHFRFHRVPSFESSSRIPIPASSFRIASARAKLRVRFARSRSSTKA